MEVFDRKYERGGITMAYSDSPGPPGQTFVLVHGIGMGRVVYSKVAEVLVTRGRVLSVDLPGFGDSPEPGSTTSLEISAEVIADFVRDVAGEPVVLVGHSMGTQIVAETAYRHPDLVSKLVLIAPTVNRHERTALKQAARMVQDLVGEGPRVLFIGLWEYMKTSPRWFIEKLRFMLRHKIEEIWVKSFCVVYEIVVIPSRFTAGYAAIAAGCSLSSFS